MPELPAAEERTPPWQYGFITSDQRAPRRVGQIIERRALQQLCVRNQRGYGCASLIVARRDRRDLVLPDHLCPSVIDYAARAYAEQAWEPQRRTAAGREAWEHLLGEWPIPAGFSSIASATSLLKSVRTRYPDPLIVRPFPQPLIESSPDSYLGLAIDGDLEGCHILILGPVALVPMRAVSVEAKNLPPSRVWKFSDPIVAIDPMDAQSSENAEALERCVRDWYDRVVLNLRRKGRRVGTGRFKNATECNAALQTVIRILADQKRDYTQEDVATFFRDHSGYPECSNDRTIRAWLQRHKLGRWESVVAQALAKTGAP